MLHEENLAKPKVNFRVDYQVPNYLIETVDLQFELGEDFTTVESKLAVVPNPAHTGARGPLILTGLEMELLQVSIDGQEVAKENYTVSSESLTLSSPDQAFQLKIRNRIKPQENTRLMGLYKSSGTFCTQCESDGFRRITYYLDRPDVMAKFRVRITADKSKYPLLLSNGNLVEDGVLENGQHWAQWEDPFPKPAYLFALVAGDLARMSDTYTTTSGRTVKLDIFTEHGQLDKCDHAMKSLKASLKWDEDTYGLECDLDNYMIVAVSDFNMGAMENKGLNVFNTKYVLADSRTATDTDYLGVEGVIGHEYFHNWTGNRVTVRDWFQLTLKEGLTVFRDQQFSADLNSKTVKRIQDVRALRAAQFPEDAGPMSHPIRPDSYIEMNNFYTSTVYNKGAEVIRMIHTIVGEEGFRKGMDLYFERHDGQAITCDDFVAAMSDANAHDFSQFMRWYSQSGTPEVHVSTSYNEEDKTYTLHMKQTCAATAGQSEKAPFVIPIKMALLNQDGEELPLTWSQDDQTDTTRVISVTDAEQSFTFTNIDAEPIPSLLRDFSAPIRLRFPQSRENLQFLMSKDKNEFNRWEAGQKLATELILEMVAQRARGEDMVVDLGFVSACRSILEDESIDKALAALALALPMERVLAEEMATIDIDGIHHARELLRGTIACELKDSLLEVYNANLSTDEYSCDSTSMGRRALKNACLSYIALLGTEESTAICEKQYQEANNMTDRLAALSCLVDLDSSVRESTLQDFYEQFKSEALVIDKWFMLQAMSKLPNTLDNVEKLLSHPDFSMKNPNRCRALLFSFSAGNLYHFHRADGRGYDFLAEQLIALDKSNPQIAARISRSFDRWKKFDEGRQIKAKAALERVLATEGLSKDVHEIISKNLE